MYSQSDIVANTSVCCVSKSSDMLQKETCASSFIREQLAFSFTTYGLDANQPSLVVEDSHNFFFREHQFSNTNSEQSGLGFSFFQCYLQSRL